MASIKAVAASYQAGNPWGICQRCGFKFRLSELRTEWSGLKVCDADFDPLPDTMRPPHSGPEGLSRLDASPEPPDTFIATQVRPEDL